MTTIRIDKVSKSFGPTRAVDDVSLTIASGELFFLLGPSGCGKTTLLRMLAGFVTPDAGDLYFDDQRMNDLPPRLRNSGLVFQSYALWPHRTVAGNVAYGLEVRRMARGEIQQKVQAALKLVRLEGLGDRRVTQLSGGQQQRVALARALVIQPRVLLLDEPLSNLDARLRVEMREEIHRIHRETGLTMVYVTHDQKEALSLADRIAVMQQGRLAQLGPPQEVYARPASRFVADFLGDSNFIRGVVGKLEETGHCVADTQLGPLQGICPAANISTGDRVLCSIRPEALRLDSGSNGVNRITATVERIAFLGEVMYVHLLAAGETRLLALSLPGRHAVWQAGAQVTVAMEPEQVVIMAE